MVVVEKKWENLFNAPANPILLEYYKRLFDQGIIICIIIIIIIIVTLLTPR